MKYLILLLLFGTAYASERTPPSNSNSNSVSHSMSKAAANSMSNSNATSNSLSSAFVGDNISGDVSISSRSFALANVLGDVDIAGCLGSTQWNTPIYGKQKLVLNWPCMTEFYIRNGMFENAQMAICNTEIRQEFETEDECRAAHPFKEIATAIIVDPEPDRDDEEYEALRYELEVIKTSIADAKVESRKAHRRPHVDPELQVQVDAAALRRANTRRILNGEIL